LDEDLASALTIISTLFEKEGKCKDNNNKKKREVDFAEYYIRFSVRKRIRHNQKEMNIYICLR